MVFEDDDQKDSLRYLKRISKIFRGSISLLVLGELYLVMLREIVNNIERSNSFRDINSLIENLNLDYVVLDIEDYIKSVKIIKNKDPRLDATNTKLLAEALGYGVDSFITTDYKIIQNQNINELISILHPEDVL